jgi:hypothetical protein
MEKKNISAKKLSSQKLDGGNQSGCITFNHSMIDKLLGTGFKYYENLDDRSFDSMTIDKRTYSDDKSKAAYFPFHLWELWEVSIFDQSLFPKFKEGSEEYKKWNKIQIHCERIQKPFFFT